MPKLTKRAIDAIEPQVVEVFIWDESSPGFGLCVIPSVHKSFVVRGGPSSSTSFLPQ